MSGNAALAAARRRRGEDPAQNIAPPRSSMKQPQYQNVSYDNGNYNRDPDTKISPLQCVLEHDKQIWVLERKIELLEENSGNNDNTLSSETENLINTNNSEVRLLKSTLQKQQKSLQELNTLVTSLRATLSNNNVTIEELTQRLNTMESSQNLDNKSTIK
tara:strand:- start:1133 stop:1612 length:480 start_codon:yes stop_codon:yes gene_type:complete